MFSCYLKMERRQSVKKDGSESKIPRYVVTSQAGYFKPLQSIKNPKNEIVLYWNRNDKCNKNSTSETRLQCQLRGYGSLNFSSVYLENTKIGEMSIGHGEPDTKAVFTKRDKKTGKINETNNPFHENRSDGYLFLIAPDEKTIEILVVPKGRQLIRGYAGMLADGQLNEAINELRKSAKSE